MGLDIGIFLTYVGVILLIFIFGRLFVVPLKVLLKLALNSLLGGIAILAINWIGAGFDLFIPLNMLNAVIVGILGLPGAILLMILN